MAEGYGFGAEGDWKIAALGTAFKKMAEGRKEWKFTIFALTLAQ